MWPKISFSGRGSRPSRRRRIYSFQLDSTSFSAPCYLVTEIVTDKLRDVCPCAMFDLPNPPRGRVATLGEPNPDELTEGMLIIDHFAIHDAGGREVPADEPIVRRRGRLAGLMTARRRGTVRDRGRAPVPTPLQRGVHR